MKKVSKQNIKKIQHFIPKFILKKFTKDKKIKFFDKRYNKSFDKSPSGSMYKEFFYEHDEFNSNEIEDLLSKREGVYAPIIEKILNKTFLTLDEHNTLIEFRHTTYYRSNEFIGFYRHQKQRGENDWLTRLDWKTINGLYKSNDWDKDIKKSQLKAIQSVIDGKDPAYLISILTPICFVFTSSNKKFMVSDSGSLCWGDEFEGVIIIVLSPTHAIVFPRLKTAMEFIRKGNYSNEESNILYEEVSDEIVDMVNNKVLEDSFEYYINPNI